MFIYMIHIYSTHNGQIDCNRFYNVFAMTCKLIIIKDIIIKIIKRIIRDKYT